MRIASRYRLKRLPSKATWGRRIDQNLDSLLAGLASPVVRYFESSVEGRQQVEEEAIRLAADSDLYKWLEGASYVFVRSGDSRLKASIDRMAVLILQCQERDGYINAQKEHKDRFDEKVCHDLYLETGREDLLQHVPGLWDEIVDSRMYVTGAVASHGESFSPEPFKSSAYPAREQGSVPWGDLRLNRFHPLLVADARDHG